MNAKVRNIPCITHYPARFAQKSSSPALECLFQACRQTFQGWERLFQGLEQRIIYSFIQF